ncbi:dTDP-glucose 4,6-dehydratase [Nocardiopsis kunsanensis]|uniref:dTDP-glucose 4,6-dehydratase n=1 Tax=Nocardiopsis kunsanensis TaxID=141693 RepID=A0A918XBU7_9ACTN|nr:dTDP-glucose 4,6-dehydratase [Nocardiopsis kunsanensis]GHD24869.1 dTDP-glucose 4,6-dehydratase [Nocardiopsis kunsanensis]
MRGNTHTTRILVTGGAGFIGSAYVRALLRAGGSARTVVTVLDKLTYAGSTDHLSAVWHHPDFAFVRGCACDADLVDGLVARHDQIVNIAAESHVDRSIRDGGAFMRTNVLGTQTLLDAAVRHGTELFLQVSTDEVYGSLAEGAADENAALHPSSPYSASKASADLVALSYARTHGLDVRVTRCANNFGPRQYPEKLVPVLLTRLLEGGNLPIYGDGRHTRDWLYVDDHVRALEVVRSSGAPGEIYNIGGTEAMTNLELAQRLLDRFGTGREKIEYVSDRKGHDRRYAVDATKLFEELGFWPQVSFEDGLKRTFDWYST